MTIYEIDREIQTLLEGGVDEETGELTVDTAKLEELTMERDRKTENLALACKNLAAEAKAIREEERALAERRRMVENKERAARSYLEYVLAGDKFKSPKVAVSYRVSKSVDVDEGFVAWAKRKHRDLLRIREPEPDKTAITALLKNGEKLKYARLVESISMTIK